MLQVTHFEEYYNWIEAILGPISVWEHFKEEVGWVLKHNMGPYVWRERRVFPIKTVTSRGLEVGVDPVRRGNEEERLS